ncbi:hypothetical protein U1Q18_031240 [Sarracenia purpurea var. burkii]
MERGLGGTTFVLVLDFSPRGLKSFVALKVLMGNGCSFATMCLVLEVCGFAKELALREELGMLGKSFNCLCF